MTVGNTVLIMSVKILSYIVSRLCLVNHQEDDQLLKQLLQFTFIYQIKEM